jgi:PAS domain S-box-containing protein
VRADLAALLHDPARLEALHRLRLLEPDAAGTFARVGRLAATLLGVPAAGVNFVDADRQFRPGAAETGQCPSELGLCQRTLLLGEPLYITDVRQDERFAADAVIREAGVVAYAGVPLYSAGQPVGTLSAVDMRPVRWTPEQRAALRDLAQLVMDELELRAQVVERRRTEQRAVQAGAEADRQARLLRAVMRQMPEGVVVASAPDGELTAANDEFRRLLGHTMLAAATIEEYGVYPVLHPDGTPYLPREMPVARALLHGEVITTEELRYRRDDGRIIDLWVRAAPVRDHEDEIIAAVGIFTDITERKRLEQTLRVSQSRFEFLSEASALVSSSLEPMVVVEKLARLVVDRLADWCAIVEPDQHQRLRRVCAAHRNPQQTRHIRNWLDRPPIDLASRSALATSFLERRTVRLDDPTPAQVAGRFATSEGYADLLANLGHHSVIAVPLAAAGLQIGCMAFVRDKDRPPFDDDEMALAVELAGRAAVALSHARRYEHEHSTAETLQRSLLPRLSDLVGLEVCASYVPGSNTLAVGGDFYDVLDLGAGRTGLVVGDMMGHGIAAAAAMGQVRAALRAYARLGMPPVEVLAALDGLVADMPDGMLATCVYGVYDMPAGELRLASAGHLSPLLRLPSGEVVPLLAPPSPPLGTGRKAFTETVHPVPAGAVLALFSDGLVEDRTRDLDTGLVELSVALSGHAGGPLERAGAAVLHALDRADGPEDDVALLLVRARTS